MPRWPWPSATPLALAVVAGAAVVISDQASSSSQGTSTVTAVLDLVLGVVLLGVGARRLRRRTGGAPAAGLPNWLARVGSMSVVFAFALGVFLPPYVVAAAAGSEIVRQGLGGGLAWFQAVVFVAVACLGVLVPIVVVVASPGGAERRLATWRAWLERHWQTVVGVILVVAGVYLAVKGGVELVRD